MLKLSENKRDFEGLATKIVQTLVSLDRRLVLTPAEAFTIVVEDVTETADDGTKTTTQIEKKVMERDWLVFRFFEDAIQFYYNSEAVTSTIGMKYLFRDARRISQVRLRDAIPILTLKFSKEVANAKYPRDLARAFATLDFPASKYAALLRANKNRLHNTVYRYSLRALNTIFARVLANATNSNPQGPEAADKFKRR